MQKKFLDFCNVKGPDSKYLNRQGGFWILHKRIRAHFVLISMDPLVNNWAGPGLGLTCHSFSSLFI